MGFRICLAAGCAILAIGIVASAPVAPANAAGSDISYDEITKFFSTGGGPGPQPPAPGTYANGSFDGDWQAATVTHRGLFAMVSNAIGMFKNGIPSSYYYLNNMERVDDPKGQTADITLPDKRQRIHLDLAKKTYYIESPGSAKAAPSTPQQPMPGPQGTMPPSKPGTVKLAITITTKPLGSINIGGINADGYQQTFKVVASNATGSCKNGTFETTMTEYLTQYAEPNLSYPESAHLPKRPQNPLTNPETMALQPGCTPTITARVHNGGSPPSGRFAVWTLMSLTLGMNGQSAGMAFLTERGDIKELGPGDAGLFAPPAGFTQVQPPQ
jgi:hypothetical protein